jgi:hypothetical protein
MRANAPSVMLYCNDMPMGGVKTAPKPLFMPSVCTTPKSKETVPLGDTEGVVGVVELVRAPPFAEPSTGDVVSAPESIKTARNFSSPALYASSVVTVAAPAVVTGAYQAFMCAELVPPSALKLVISVAVAEGLMLVNVMFDNMSQSLPKIISNRSPTAAAGVVRFILDVLTPAETCVVTLLMVIIRTSRLS